MDLVWRFLPVQLLLPAKVDSAVAVGSEDQGEVIVY